MHFTLLEVCRDERWRPIVTINVDYINTDIQLGERYQIMQRLDIGRYITLHEMGSRTVGIVYIGADLKEALEEVTQLII
jgi:hypothetical protein